MNNIVNRSGRTIMPMSKVFAGLNTAGELTEGVAVSFPMLGIKGKMWHYRHKGEDHVIPDPSAPDGRPAWAIPVVIVQGSKTLTRTFYPAGTFVENSRDKPACWSSDGVKPDDIVPEKQHPTCVGCPKNEWSSGGVGKAKACQSRRRLVVVPYNPSDLANESGGGPVLLSVSPASLKNLVEYANYLNDNGVDFPGVATQLSFDPDVKLAYGKIVFTYLHSLNDDEAAVIAGMRDTDAIKRILNSRINIDGPEVDDGGVTNGNFQPPKPAADNAPRPTAPPPPAKTSVAKSAPPPPPPPPSPPAPPQTVKAAPAPALQSVPKVGGFAAPTAAAGAQASMRAPIAEAVSKPAAPPPSARPVVAAPPQAPSNGGEGEDELATERSLPDELTNVFGNLMGRG